MYAPSRALRNTIFADLPSGIRASEKFAVEFKFGGLC
jgi:hypothetical protein